MHPYDDVIPKPTSHSTTTPAGFDPRRYPVIGTHFFGIPRPWQHVGTIVGTMVAALSINGAAPTARASAAADTEAPASRRDTRHDAPDRVSP